MAPPDELDRETVAGIIVRFALAGSTTRPLAAHLLARALARVIGETPPQEREQVRAAALHTFAASLQEYGL